MDRTSILSEQGLCALQDTDIAMILYDEFADISYANSSFCSLVGYPAEEVQQMNIADFDLNHTRAQLADLLQEKSSARIESELQHKDGTRTLIEVISKSHRHDETRYFSAFIIDISERKRIKIELLKAQLAVEHSTDAISWYRADGTIIYANQRLCKWLGYTSEELLTMTCTDIAPTLSKQEALEIFATWEREGTVEFEGTRQAKDGTSYPVEVVGNFYSIDGEKIFCAFVRDISKLKNSQKLLRLNQFGVDSAPDAVLWVNADATITYANDAAARVFGTTRELLTQSIFLDLESGLTEASWKDRLENSGNDSPFRLESKLAKVSEGEFDAEMHFNRLQFEGEDLLLVSIKDVTQNKLESKSLRQSRYVIDQFADAIVLCNKDAVVIDVNEAQCQRLGYTKSELLGQSVALFDKHLYSADGEHQDLELLSEVAAAQQFAFETVHTAKDGTEFNVEIQATRDVLDGEELIYSVIRDITQRIRGRERTERQLGLTIQAVDKSIDAMFWHDGEGAFTYVSDRACESLGYTRDELLQLGVFDIDRHAEKKADLCSASVQDSAPAVIESEHRRKDGTYFPVEVRVSKLSHGDEAVYCAVARDLTNSKAQEERLSDLSSQVAHLNRVGSMGQMASAIAHELNQPLSAISNNAFLLNDMIKKGGTNQFEAERISRELSEQAVMSGEIVHRLRGYTTNTNTHRELLQVNQVVDDSIKLLAHRIRHSRVTVETSLSTALPLVSVDRVELQQVIVNLLVNALEAIEESGTSLKVIDVRSEYCDESNCARIKIGDSGPGVSEEIRDRLFEPFCSTKQAGMGMGLAISRNIMESYNGTLDFTSPETGTVFHIELPTDSFVQSLNANVDSYENKVGAI